MRKLVAIAAADGLAIGLASPAFAAGKGGSMQGSGPGSDGTGDKASQFPGPGPGNSFKLPNEGGYKSPSGKK